MALQVFNEPLTDLRPDQSGVRSEKVRIIADTVIHQDGKGVPVYEGSIVNVRPEVARILYSSIKAVPANPDDKAVFVTQEQCYALRTANLEKKKQAAKSSLTSPEKK